MSELIKNPSKQNEKSISYLLDTLTGLKRDAYSNLDQALSTDSADAAKKNSDVTSTVILYENCLGLIKKAIAFYEENQTRLNQYDDAVRIYNQLISMRIQTNERLNNLKNKQSLLASDAEFINISDNILIEDSDDDIILIEDEKNQLQTTETKTNVTSNSSIGTLNLNDFKNATEIIRLENAAKLFYIGSEGDVSSPSKNKTISVLTLNEGYTPKDSKTGKSIVAFLKSGNWIYPLISDESPAMKTNFDAYIFPNNDEELNNEKTKCEFIGITFEKNVANEEIAFFEDVLANYGSLVYQDKNEKSGVRKPSLISGSTQDSNKAKLKTSKINTTAEEKAKEASSSMLVEEVEDNKNPPSDMKQSWSAEYIAEKLVNGAQYISTKVNSTTEYANKYIKTGGEQIKSQVQPNDQPTKIDPKVKSAFQNIRYGSHVTVRVSSYLVKKLGSLATYTAKTVAPHLREGGTHLLTKTGIVSNKENASSYLDNVCTVTSSSIEGASIIMDSLEQAAKTLAKNITEQTVTVVSHKYGEDAAKVTENSMYSVGNVAESFNNYKSLKIVRTFAKATARETIRGSEKNASDSNESKEDDLKKSASNSSLKK